MQKNDGLLHYGPTVIKHVFFYIKSNVLSLEIASEHIATNFYNRTYVQVDLVGLLRR